MFHYKKAVGGSSLEFSGVMELFFAAGTRIYTRVKICGTVIKQKATLFYVNKHFFKKRKKENKKVRKVAVPWQASMLKAPGTEETEPQRV